MDHDRQADSLETSQSQPLPSTDVPFPRLLVSGAALAVFMCAAFTATAAAFLWLAFLWGGHQEDPGFMARLLVKAILFTCLAGASVVALWALARPAFEDGQSGPRPEVGTGRSRLGLACAFLFAAALVFPRLTAYPHALPDETHHLIVARNLAEHGLYASGHPEKGFVLFDNYDSVGPPVLLPVAGALRLGGSGLYAGRAVMALFFLALCGAVYGFCKPLFGAAAAIGAVFMATMALMSVYLGRSLYGEAPALLFFIVGLILWRRALTDKTSDLYALAAGAALGLAVLSKSFMVLSAWAFVGAVIYDRMTFRRIRWPHLAWLILGNAAVIGAWWVFKGLHHHDVARAAASTIGEYQHNLMFGLDPVAQTLGWLLGRPATLLVSVAAMVMALPVIFHKNYDPPAVVLFMFATLVTYWWVFFTPGNIPRYLWYSFAVAGIYTGPMLLGAVKTTTDRNRRTLQRALCAVTCCAVMVPALGRSYVEVDRIYAHDDMRDDRALAEYVKGLPDDLSIATTFWPSERSLNFLANRSVNLITGLPETHHNYDVIVVDAQTQSALLAGQGPSQRIGRYVIVHADERS